MKISANQLTKSHHFLPGDGAFEAPRRDDGRISAAPTAEVQNMPH